jgi:copper chaperone CopZ
MQTFWCQRAVPVALLIAGFSMSLPAAATPPTKERLPLTLSGSGCDSKETQITTVLQGIPGVTGIYFNRMPNHVLVDVTPGTVKAADVVDRVNEAAASWQCKVEIIEGCISASMPTASAAPHHSE